MTLHEIVTRTNDAIGATGAECIDTLAPWVVMNAHYEVFHDYIEHSKGTHKLAQYGNAWYNAYKKFNSKFNRALDEEVAIELVEVVYDDFVTSLHNDMARLIVACYNAVKSDDADLKRRFANAYLCYEFSIIAQTMFERVYFETIPQKVFYSKVNGVRVKYTIPEGRKGAKSQLLQYCENNSRAWLLEYLRVNGCKPVLRTPKLVEEERNLCRACVRWVKKMDEALVGHPLELADIDGLWK